MFQMLGDDLPPMSAHILKLRSELVHADGIHLFFNVPRTDLGEKRTGPMAPFAGLCIAVLMYLPYDDTRFIFEIGTGAKKYVIGWTNSPDFGLYSLTLFKNMYVGAKKKTVQKFPKGYAYIYFYFKDSNTLHGWVNDTYDLEDDTTHPYPVADVGKVLAFADTMFKNIKFLEIHWVAWGSSHNQSGGPSSKLVDQLFPKSDTGMVDFKDADIFEMRPGTVVIVRTKHKENASSKENRVVIGIGCATCTKHDFTSLAFPESGDPNIVYTFQITVSEKGALIHTDQEGVSYIEMPAHEACNLPCRAYLILDNVKPVHIQVETMGQTWGDH